MTILKVNKGSRPDQAPDQILAAAIAPLVAQTIRSTLEYLNSEVRICLLFDSQSDVVRIKREERRQDSMVNVKTGEQTPGDDRPKRMTHGDVARLQDHAASEFRSWYITHRQSLENLRITNQLDLIFKRGRLIGLELRCNTAPHIPAQLDAGSHL